MAGLLKHLYMLAGWALFGACTLSGAEPTTVVTIDPAVKLGKIDTRIFGHFTEDTLSSYDGGIWSEMLYNRKFEMPEVRSATNFLFTGAAGGWEPIEQHTAVTLVPDQRIYYSPSHSQRITSTEPGIPAGIQQSGYRYVMPHISPLQRLDAPFHFKPAQRYRVRVAIKNQNVKGAVHVALGGSWRAPVATCALPFAGGEDWKVHTCELAPTAEARDGKFMIWIDSPGTIWIDSVSMVRQDLDDGGFRKDALDLTRRTEPTSIRWPGGWFVSDYQWQHGIGPIDKRPAELNRAWMAYTNNDVGVDEFISLCRKLRADPYICVNVGTGTPEDAAALVEYVNGSKSTKWGRMRAANGHPEPYRVKTWNLGNEEYLPTLGGSGGRLYGERSIAFAKAMKAVDPSIELVAVGAFDIPKGALTPESPIYKIVRYLVDWNKETLPLAGKVMDSYSIHHYAPEDATKDLSAEDVFRYGLVSAENLSAKLDVLQRQMDQYAGRRYPIALDEWAVWLAKEVPPEAGPVPPPGLKKKEDFGLYGPAGMLRDALFEAPVYNLMQRRPKDFALASRTLIYGYAMGMIGTSHDKAAASPSALMLELYSTRDQCEALKTEVRGSGFSVPPKGGFTGAKDAPYLDVSARVRSDAKTVEVFVVNRNLKDDMDAAIRVVGRPFDSSIQVAVLNSASIRDWNSFDEPNRVRLQTKEVRAQSTELRHIFPAHSITRLTMHLK